MAEPFNADSVLLTAIVGYRLAKRLISVFGGMQIYIPKTSKNFNIYKEVTIDGVKKAAKKFGISEWAIKRLLRIARMKELDYDMLKEIQEKVWKEDKKE